MTPLLSDVRLARQAGDGEQRAFEAIYKRYHQDIYRFCLSILGRPEDAQDALQNTMVKALRALPGEQREIKLKPWLYRVAHNESIDLLRRRREGVELDDASMSAGVEIAETAAQRERLGRLLADLSELPERQRSALVMRELGGLGYEQIGAAFESSSAVARQTVYEARLGLRELETGREMSCEQVTRQLSEADGRVARRRDIRAHLRSCPKCRAFRDSIDGRRRDLQALAPLPAAAAASIMHGLLGGNLAASGGLGGAASAAGAGAGKAAGTSVAVKAVATVAVVATIGVTAAHRGGLVNAGLPGGDKGESSKSTPASSGSGDAAAGGSRAATAPHHLGATESNSKTGLNAAAPAAGHDQAGTSPAEITTPADTPTQPTEGGNGPPISPSEASRHGQETAAAHKATSKGKSKAHPGHPTHPGHPPHLPNTAKGEQGNGKAEGNGQAAQPNEGNSAKAHTTHATEPSEQAKSEGSAKVESERGKGEANESKPSP
jgi:RNA polymerase sigma factor (sigma-70 family)